jgi:hypothetical protein
MGAPPRNLVVQRGSNSLHCAMFPLGVAPQSDDARCASTCAELSKMTVRVGRSCGALADSAKAISTNQSIGARHVIAVQLNSIPHGHDEFAG